MNALVKQIKEKSAAYKNKNLFNGIESRGAAELSDCKTGLLTHGPGTSSKVKS